MEAFREAASTQAKAKLAELPTLIGSHMTFITETFGASQAAAVAGITAAAGDLKAGKANSMMNDLMMKVGEQLSADIGLLQLVARWISLSVPVVEDGNNFGCDVQAYVLKIVQEFIKSLQGHLDAMSTYYKDRGEAIAKLVPATSRKTTSSKSTSNSTGGKQEEAGDKTSSSESSESSTSESDVVEDTINYVVMHDLKWYNKLKGMSVDMMDALAVVSDTTAKNMKKIEAPRGESGGSGFNMY